MSNDKILNEIGELFGRYRNEYGQMEFFQKKLMQNITFGRLNKDYDDWLKSYTLQNPEPDKQERDSFMSGILNSDFYSQRFYAWQKRVIDRLQNTNNDVYVVAPPGGGKTTPLMAHYLVDLFMGGKNGDMHTLRPSDIFSAQSNPEVVRIWTNIFTALLTKKYLNGQSVPRCLFVTPIRVLSFEQAEGFQDYFLDLLLLLKSLMMKATQKNDNESLSAYLTRLNQNQSNIDRIISGTFRASGETWFNSLNVPPDAFNSFAKSFTEKLIYVKTGGGSGQYDTPPDKGAIVSIATYGSAKNFISKISNTVKFIVFDEAHLYMPSEYGPKSDRSQENEVRAAADAYTIVEGMAKQRGAQIAFLSGTIHPISAQNFCDFLNRRYGRNLVVVSTEKGDTQSGNKTELHVIPDDSIREEREQVNRIVQWVQRNEKGNAIILFSKKKINTLVDEALKRLSQKDIRDDFNVDQSDRYRREKIDRYKRSLAYSNPDATQEEIQRQVNNFIKKEFPSSQREKIEKIKAKPGAMMIQNKKLRNAVSYGIGYIYRQDDVELNDPRAIVGEVIEPIAEQDKLIVAKLFSEGKINVLLATAAIGVGVNVNIKNMYLPSCMKFEKNKNNEGKFDLNNKREMSQLVNRTGRGKTPISGIYTPSEFVPFMRDVVMSGVEDFNKVPAISVRPTDNLKDILLNLSNAASSGADKSILIGKNTSRIINQKLSNFRAAANRIYLKRGQIVNTIKNHDWLGLQKKRLDKIRENTLRHDKYVNTKDKIEEYNYKLNHYETEIQNTERLIADLQEELAGSVTGIQTTDVRKQEIQKLMLQARTDINNLMISEKTCAVELYNEIKKELNDIHDGSLKNGGIGVYRSSRHNKAMLDSYLETIRRKFDPELLSDREEKSIRKLNDEVENYNKFLQDLRNKLASYQNNSNIPQTTIDDLNKEIRRIHANIQHHVNQIRNIKFYNGPAVQPSGNIIY